MTTIASQGGLDLEGLEKRLFPDPPPTDYERSDWPTKDELRALISRVRELEADLKLAQVEADNWRHAAQHPEIYTTTSQEMARIAALADSEEGS